MRKYAIFSQNGDDVRIESFTGEEPTKFDLMSMATKMSGQPNARIKQDDGEFGMTAISGDVKVDSIVFDHDTKQSIFDIWKGA